MQDIIISHYKVNVFAKLEELCDVCNMGREFLDELWEEMLFDDLFMDEFVYYVNQQGFQDRLERHGYRMTDIYFWRMNRYNLIHDIGRNPLGCDKRILVLEAFHTMMMLRKDPDTYTSLLCQDKGMDRFR